MLMTCPKCGQLTKGQTGDQCPKCKIFLRPAAEIGELQQRRERMQDEPSIDAPEEAGLRKCPKCGAPIAGEDASFCAKCGAKLEAYAPEKPAKKGSGATAVIVWIIIFLLLGLWGKASHQKWVDEQMKHFRGTDYTYSDKEIQRELDKIWNTFGR